MEAILISIGNELLNGRTTNTNATFIAGKLFEIGIRTRKVVTIGDDQEGIRQALGEALTEADLVILTGGLGPTHDDVTKKAVADYFDAPLALDPAILKRVEDRFRKRGMAMPEVNRNQALVPRGARILENPIGTAPGLHFSRQGREVFVLPGVPKEMKALVEGAVLPYLSRKTGRQSTRVEQFRTTGIAESRLYEKLKDLLDAHPEFEVAFLPKFTGVDIRVIFRGKVAENAQRWQAFEHALVERIGQYIYARGQEELEAVVGRLLRENKLTLAVAESCTGGLLQDRITNVSGSSTYFLGGMVTYSNQSKMQLLGVQEASLANYGAVSEVVAREMAAGVQRIFQASYALSTTGIAGPTGASPTKPVGLVYVGLAGPEGVVARRFQFVQDRRLNKELAAQAALDFLRRALLGLPVGQVLTGSDNRQNP